MSIETWEAQYTDDSGTTMTRHFQIETDPTLSEEDNEWRAAQVISDELNSSKTGTGYPRWYRRIDQVVD